jgi:hypothetical protein
MRRRSESLIKTKSNQSNNQIQQQTIKQLFLIKMKIQFVLSVGVALLQATPILSAGVRVSNVVGIIWSLSDIRLS